MLMYIRGILATRRGHPGTQNVPSLPSIHMLILQTFIRLLLPRPSDLPICHFKYEWSGDGAGFPRNVLVPPLPWRAARQVSSIADAIGKLSKYLGRPSDWSQSRVLERALAFSKALQPCTIDNLDFNSHCCYSPSLLVAYRADL